MPPQSLHGLFCSSYQAGRKLIGLMVGRKLIGLMAGRKLIGLMAWMTSHMSVFLRVYRYPGIRHACARA